MCCTCVAADFEKFLFKFGVVADQVDALFIEMKGDDEDEEDGNKGETGSGLCYDGYRCRAVEPSASLWTIPARSE